VWGLRGLWAVFGLGLLLTTVGLALVFGSMPLAGFGLLLVGLGVPMMATAALDAWRYARPLDDDEPKE
jgi:hypothetical protein